ncbi:MAG: PhoPQ-activated pathogenicity-related family protein [Pirellula sp.]
MCLRWMLIAVIGFFFMEAWVHGEPPAGVRRTALDEYVGREDSAYSWKLQNSIRGDGWTMHVIRLTSQTWLTEAEVDRPLWEHWLTVTIPDRLKTEHVFLFIGGGSHQSEDPKGPDSVTLGIAKATQGIVAELKNIPNQPLVFHGDGQPRSEDDLIGYAWSQFLDTGDAKWLPRLPMVKSVVRAMDCITEFAATETGGKRRLEKFVLGGGSKRGWTTWLAGVADRRVVAIVPIVIDVANVYPSLKNHAEAYGFWAEAIGNYYQHRILQRFDHPRLKDLYAVVDPFSYRDRLTMPKFVLNASGDQFFTPDSSKFYFEDLPGEKLLRYVPNADHGLKNSDAVESVAAYFAMVASGRASPQVEWTFEEDGSMVVHTSPAAKHAIVWRANNPNARDFRLQTLGPAFQGTPLQPAANGEYVVPPAPDQPGWTASFLELTFDVGASVPLKVTTGVQITPDVLPFAGIDPSKVPYEGKSKTPR